MNSNYQILYFQKRSVEKQFNCFKCSVKSHGQYMICKGALRPLDNIEPYLIDIMQFPGNPPKVFIKSPKVEYNQKTHMYKEGNLCLYYPPDFNWKSNTSIAFYTIPWINEWIIYYELFKISGEWEGPAATHSLNK